MAVYRTKYNYNLIKMFSTSIDCYRFSKKGILYATFICILLKDTRMLYTISLNWSWSELCDKPKLGMNKELNDFEQVVCL